MLYNIVTCPLYFSLSFPFVDDYVNSNNNKHLYSNVKVLTVFPDLTKTLG